LPAALPPLAGVFPPLHPSPPQLDQPPQDRLPPQLDQPPQDRLLLRNMRLRSALPPGSVFPSLLRQGPSLFC
jgi:hypothetical protein